VLDYRLPSQSALQIFTFKTCSSLYDVICSRIGFQLDEPYLSPAVSGLSDDFNFFLEFSFAVSDHPTPSSYSRFLQLVPAATCYASVAY
jgi:hypothetical protein